MHVVKQLRFAPLRWNVQKSASTKQVRLPSRVPSPNWGSLVMAGAALGPPNIHNEPLRNRSFSVSKDCVGISRARLIGGGLEPFHSECVCGFDTEADELAR